MAEAQYRGLAVPHLAAWRNYRIMSQQQLANNSGVSRSAIADAEQGKRVRASNIHKLAGALAITPDMLVHQAPGKLYGEHPDQEQETATREQEGAASVK